MTNGDAGTPGEELTASLDAGGRSLRRALSDAGIDEAGVARAEEAGVLGILAIERFAVPEPGRYDIASLAEVTGMDPDHIRVIWRSLGLPEPRPGQKVFTEVDAQVIGLVSGLMEVGLIEPDLVAQMSRVIGWSLARVANAFVDSIEGPPDPTDSDPDDADLDDADLDDADTGESASEGLRSEDSDVEDSDPGSADRDRTLGGTAGGGSRPSDPAELASLASTMLPMMTDVIGHVWRRHLQIAARRRLIRELDGEERREQAVGFADQVGFTTLAQQVDDHTLAGVVARFEEIAYDTVTSFGGRVVKMIGDEVMYAVDDPADAVRIGLALAEEYAADEALSDVRVGIAYGPVLEREADLYGPVVNLASRIVNLAFPGSVVTTGEVHDAVADDERLKWKPIKARRIKDIGRVPLWSVRPAEDADRSEPWSEVRERRTKAREARLAALDHPPRP